MEPSEAVYSVVRQIPNGRVATYGQVADMVDGISVSAREVGWLMYACPPDVPWQRVVGSGGHLLTGKRSAEMKMRQRQLLEAEGVMFLPNECVDMARFQLKADEPALPAIFD